MRLHHLALLSAIVAGLWFSTTGMSFQDPEQPRDVVGPNLVKNSSLEDVKDGIPVGWTQRTWSGEPTYALEDEFGHSGKRCVKISSTAGADASWSYELKVKPNTDYRLSAWIKTESIDAGGFGAQLNLHELQMEGKTEPIRGSKDWTRVTSEFNSGSRNTLLLNLLYGGWGRATGTAWFDDIEVREVKSDQPEPPQMSEDDAKEFFASKVLPILESKCFECHGGGEKIKAEFVLTNRDDLLKGGETGEAIDLESPLDSLLVTSINYESYEMPPTGKLPKEEIDILTQWVQMGVPWKGDGFKPESMPEKRIVPTVNAETKKWWSFQQTQRPDVPVSGDKWITNEIDEFILDKLKSKGLVPNHRASKQALIRRAYYDLIGLPPSVEQVKQFVDDNSPDAYEKLIDSLLTSKHYGEKWGRHWLDLVRYAESNSYERDGTKPFIWRYRDYVIQSLNADKPYDQFVIEQLAGDELEEETPDSLIATGYYRLGKWDDEPVDHKQAWFDDADDILATTSQAFLGMTINCARCHDHKIDPVPQSDYYSLLAFFRNIQRYGIRGHDTVLRQSSRYIATKKVRDAYSQEVEAHKKAVQENRAALVKIEAVVKKDFIPVEHEEFKHEMNRVPLVQKRIGKTIDGIEFVEADAKKYEQLFNQMKQLRRSPPKDLERALCVTEKGAKAPETHILVRGNAQAEGDPVQPGFPSVLSPPEPVIETPSDGESTGRRLALARWIASPDNPLTSRVMVNRIWQHHFGRGIVRSSNDFGFQGTPPTHPELLDWLAAEFVDGDWKMKRLHKMIMMSSTYRMSSDPQEKALAEDPLNDHFWRFDMRRLTAEEVRDSILAVNGTLNREKMFGPSIYPKIEAEVLHGQSRPGENWGNSSPEDITRRSIYIHIKRSLPVPLMASFDVADPDSTCPVRFNTVQPTQALGMLNSQFVNQEAAKLAAHVRKHVPDDVSEQIEFVLRQVFQRDPTESEVDLGIELLKDLQTRGLEPDKTFELYCVVALNLNEFLFLD